MINDPKAFLKIPRKTPLSRNPKELIKDFQEIYLPHSEDKTKEQANRCMDCGVPFCHNGCPLGNLIPDFNEAVTEGKWELAYQTLSKTNNFPEFTGRICPAPCEASCVLGINENPVAIEHIEKSIIEMAFEKGWVRPEPPTLRTGRKISIIGSGPAGLATAAQLNKFGHTVTVYERNDRIGGLLRYGIPDFKLEKKVVDRRIHLMESEGIKFKTNANVGVNIDAKELLESSDAMVLCGGSTIPRDLPIKGRSATGIHFAMDFLEQNNKRVAEDNITEPILSAKGKKVVVIGGGDTGADCVGTSNRQGATSVTQIELLIQPPNTRDESTPWPLWPMQLRTSSSHEEGCDRQWAILTKEFIKRPDGSLQGIKTVKVDWKDQRFTEIPGTEEIIECDMVLLAVGFTNPQLEGILSSLGVTTNERNLVEDHQYQTNVEKVFVAGDMRRGQSLVVWALAEGRAAAEQVEIYFKMAWRGGK